ncbi:MAG: hypothetical protein ACTSR0_02875 [Candidatus Asgardarchaeia archaeon]
MSRIRVDGGMTMDKDVGPAMKVKLKSLKDLVRLAVTWSLRQNPTAILYFRGGGSSKFMLLAIIDGYYDYSGLPVLFYTESDEELEDDISFIAYNAEGEEKVEFKSAIDDRTLRYIPIIRLSEVPEFLKI